MQQVIFETGQNSCLDLVMADGQHVLTSAFVLGIGAAEKGLAHHRVAPTTTAAG